MLLAQEFGCKKDSPELPGQEMALWTMPDFSVIDPLGNILKPEEYRGVHHCLVVFVDADIETDLECMKKAYHDFQGEGIQIIGVSRDISRIQAKSASYPFFYIQEAYEEAANRFRAPRHQSAFYLFSAQGILLHSGLLGVRYETHLKKILNSCIRNKRFTAQDLFPRQANLSNEPWHLRLEEILHPSKEYHLGAFFNAFCDACQSGRILSFMKDVTRINPSQWGCFIVFKDDLGEQDIENFRSQMKVDFPLVASSREFKSKWESLADEYSESELNEIVVIVDHQGNIIESFGSNENLLKDIRKFIFSERHSESTS